MAMHCAYQAGVVQPIRKSVPAQKLIAAVGEMNDLESEIYDENSLFTLGIIKSPPPWGPPEENVLQDYIRDTLIPDLL